MDNITKVKSLSLWIFIVPFVGINLCLLIVTQFHELVPNKVDIIHGAFPYIDGKASISRTARVFPTYLIFKPAMFLTSYLLIKYWNYNKIIFSNFNVGHKNIKYFYFFGISSAIFLSIHSLFLGIKFDYDLYKFLRRFVMISFIVFEIIAQTYLVLTIYSLKDKIIKFINPIILKLKIALVALLIIVAFIAIPIIIIDNNKYLKHAIEWNYFIGVIGFYFLTYRMWLTKK